MYCNQVFRFPYIRCGYDPPSLVSAQNQLEGWNLIFKREGNHGAAGDEPNDAANYM